MAELRNPPQESGDKLVMTLTEEHFDRQKTFLLEPIGYAEEYILKLRQADKEAIADCGWARLKMRDFQDGSVYQTDLTKHGNITGGVGKEYILDDWHKFVDARNNNNNPSNFHLRPGAQVAFCVRDGVLHFSARAR